jgi:hypothetical protein
VVGEVCQPEPTVAAVHLVAWAVAVQVAHRLAAVVPAVQPSGAVVLEA